MTKIKRRVFLLAAIATIGCRQKKTKLKAYPGHVAGVVKLDGVVLKDGTVTFIPQQAEDQGGKTGIGRIQQDGSYRIGNSNPDDTDGLPPGDYKVTILAMEPAKKPGDPIATPKFPSRYTDDRTTPFQAKVVAGVNRLDWNLTTKPD